MPSSQTPSARTDTSSLPSEVLPSYRSLPDDVIEVGSAALDQTLPNSPGDDHGFPRHVKAVYRPLSAPPPPSAASTSQHLVPTLEVEEEPQKSSAQPLVPPPSLRLPRSSYIRPTPSSISLRTLLSVPASLPVSTPSGTATTIRKSHLRRAVGDGGTMRTVGSERFFTAQGETWNEGRGGQVQERGTDVLLRYFEEMNLTEEHPTLDTLRALTRDPSIPFLVPEDPPTSQDLQAATGLLDHLWSYISVPQQPVEGAKISVEYCATLYNELAGWLYPPSTDAVLFVDDSEEAAHHRHRSGTYHFPAFDPSSLDSTPKPVYRPHHPRAQSVLFERDEEDGFGVPIRRV